MDRDPVLSESWSVTSDGKAHDAFTDLLNWHGYFWLIFVSSPTHFYNKDSRLNLMRSQNAKDWETVHSFKAESYELRDPKLAVVEGQLMVIALVNVSKDPKPIRTVFTISSDGENWGSLEPMIEEPWLMGRPRSIRPNGYRAAAHRIDRGQVAFFRSLDGKNWSLDSMIIDDDTVTADESDLLQMKDGRLLVASRMEGSSILFGSDADGTMISISNDPNEGWSSWCFSSENRLDGPAIFQTPSGGVFAVGRRQPLVKAPWKKLGSVFAKRRTSLFRLGVIEENKEITFLFDLPSCGDTGYCGVSVSGSKVFVSYYTNSLTKDPNWLMGMFMSTHVRVAEIEIN